MSDAPSVRRPAGSDVSNGPAARQVSRAQWRLRQIAWVLRNEGSSGVWYRVRRRLAEIVRPKTQAWAVRTDDILNADLDHPFEPPVPAVVSGEPIWLNWIMTAPARASGGHTTIFRILRHLEANGFRSRIYLYDARLSEATYYTAGVRDHFGFAGPVLRLDGPMEDAHGVIATSWQSAYAAFNARCAGKRFYFVQDFEPSFYPASAESVLAENTYRMGFHAITAGGWLAKKLDVEYGMIADPFEFGCDTLNYANRRGARNGIAYYAKPGAPRRGYEIGMLALQLFARRRPDIDIHLYGERVEGLPFRVINHGVVTPKELNDIYNRCYAGLTLSLTNVSLVPLEMLGAGCIPVVNDGEQNRIVLNNPHVRYAALTPQALARCLEHVVASPEFPEISRAGSESQRNTTWDQAGEAVDAAIRRALASHRPVEAVR